MSRPSAILVFVLVSGCGGHATDAAEAPATGGEDDGGALNRATGGVAGLQGEDAAAGGSAAGAVARAPGRAGGGGSAGAAGAGGGLVWADTDSAVYTYVGPATAVLHNDGPSSIYVRLCPSWSSVLSGVLNLDRLDVDAWVEQCARVGCDDADSVTTPLAPGATLETEVGLNDGTCSFGVGTGRAHYTVGHDCRQDVPWSEAQCAWLEEVYSPAFAVQDCVCPVNEGRAVCPTFEMLCDAVSCPPSSLADALRPGGWATVGCGLRAIGPFSNIGGIGGLWVYDERTGELAGACVSYDMLRLPCNTLTYCFGGTRHIGGGVFPSFDCPDAVGCQYVGDDPALPENWTCAGGAGGAGGAAGSTATAGSPSGGTDGSSATGGSATGGTDGSPAIGGSATGGTGDGAVACSEDTPVAYLPCSSCEPTTDPAIEGCNSATPVLNVSEHEFARYALDPSVSYAVGCTVYLPCRMGLYCNGPAQHCWCHSSVDGGGGVQWSCFL